MKPPESTIPTAMLAAQVSPTEAFEAGLKSQVPSEIFPGIIVHHKDLMVTDRTAQHLTESKLSQPGPINPAGTFTLLTPESFALAVVNNQDDRTKVFADSENGLISCVFDFLKNGGQSRESGWGQLRAEIKFTESRKLKEWRKTLEWMNQTDFANFLEDHLEDVLEPTGQDLLSIATDLEASSSGSFKGKVNLQNGSTKLCYQDDVETTVEVPRLLTLGIPLFEHGDKYKLGARLRFVISGGSVKFKLLFTNLQDAKDQEFERIVQEIEEKASVSIYRGRLSLPW
jgi:uncharacterized protein YfdQ (DUF2303 family)